MQGLSENRNITNGFLLSLVAGVLVLVNGIVWFMLVHFFTIIPGEMVISEEMAPIMILSLPFIILGSIGILFAIAIFIGTLFIYMYGNKSTGGKIVLAFSILSIAAGGGFIIGMIIGIVGGAFGIAKK